MFSACFAQPVRGGVKHNLTARVQAQLRLFDEGAAMDVIKRIGPSGIANGRSNRCRATPDLCEKAARRASIKLGDGDVMGAIRFLCSSESGVVNRLACFAELLSKHPPTPPNRRVVPVPVVGTLVVTHQEVVYVWRM